MNEYISTTVLKQLKTEGFKEVRVEGPQGSGKSSMVRKHYPNHELKLLEEGGSFERWLVRQKHPKVAETNIKATVLSTKDYDKTQAFPGIKNE